MSEIEKPFAQGFDQRQPSAVQSTGRQIVMIFDDVHLGESFAVFDGVEELYYGVLRELMDDSRLMISRMVKDTKTGTITLNIRFRTEEEKGDGYFEVPHGDLASPHLKRAAGWVSMADTGIHRLKANPAESSPKGLTVSGAVGGKFAMIARFLRWFFGSVSDDRSPRRVAAPSELDISEQVDAATKKGLKGALKVPTYFPRD